MNRFGRQAMNTYNEYAPERVDEMDDPEAYFTQLGVDAEEAWAALWPTLVAKVDNPNGDYSTEVGKYRAAQQAAEEIIMAEWCVPSDVPLDVDDSGPDVLGAELDQVMREVRAELGETRAVDKDWYWPPNTPWPASTP